MEKLIKLLDEFDHKKTEDLEWGKQRVENQKLWIISKDWWFIERLYNHKKMTLERLKVSDLYWDINDWVWPVDNIIMHLSISENPIKLLISLLK